MSEENKGNNNTPPRTNNKKPDIDPISARLDLMEKDLKGTIDRQTEVIEKQAKENEELRARLSLKDNDEDDAILIDRRSSNTMRLPVVGDAPVIEGKLERVIGIPGLEYLMHVKTADGKKHIFPMGCDVNRIDFKNEQLKGVHKTSYENIQTKDFALVDIDDNDLTGASKIEKGKISSEGGVIQEVDRSSGRPQFTGRKIRTVVRRDIRYYTIEFGDEKFTLSSAELGNIRI